jgi:NitT/TauT family transport system substrate-binding protein
MHRFIVILFCAACLAGCGDSETASNPAETSTLVLQLNWKPEPQFGGFYNAELIGAFKKRGLTVDIRPGGSGAPTIEMIGAGTVPFALVSADEIVRARTKGNMVVALFAVYQTNPQGIMTRADRKFESIGDVFTHDGTLAMERGLPYSDFLEKKFGFGKLKIVPSPFGDLTLFRNDLNYSMQCFVTSEPIAAKRVGVNAKSFLIAEAGYNPYTTVLATRDSFLVSNPKAVKEMVAAVKEGWQAYLKDPSGANEMMQKLNPTMDADTFKQSAEAQLPLIIAEDPDGADVGAMRAGRWQTLVDQLVELKAIEKPIPASECYAAEMASHTN